jgi:hypothetical protein
MLVEDNGMGDHNVRAILSLEALEPRDSPSAFGDFVWGVGRMGLGAIIYSAGKAVSEVRFVGGVTSKAMQAYGVKVFTEGAQQAGSGVKQGVQALALAGERAALNDYLFANWNQPNRLQNLVNFHNRFGAPIQYDAPADTGVNFGFVA